VVEMKIAVCGKGGTGKSTVVALLASGFKEKGMGVIIIDSDESNSGLHWMLGLDRRPSPLMDFVGGKKEVQGKMIAMFSRGQSEPEMSILLQDVIRMEDIPEDYMVQVDGKRLITIGKIEQSLEGCACPMGAVSREFLKKLRLCTNEIAIVDMEAGIEHFGRGVESTNFAGVVVNKVSSDNIYEKIREELEKKRLPILGKIQFSKRIVGACLQGQPIRLADSGGEVMEIIERLQTMSGVWKEVN
jgi:CO dehydrogenase maturation factor